MSTFLKTAPHDALKLLAANHAALLAMFRDYERGKKGADAIEKGKQALRICHRLSIQCAITEEFFYPAVAAVLGKDGEAMVQHALAEQGAMRGKIAEIEEMPSRDVGFDPAMGLLGDMARGRFEEEEEKLFPKIRHSGFDLVGTGEKLATRQLQLSTAPAGKADVREARRVLGG
jgi:hypothetical protein